MKKHNIQKENFLAGFEHKVGELISLAFALTEERLSALKRPSPTCKAQASAALAVKHALETFMTIAKLEE